MAPKFGTSGLRGLVTELTRDLVSDYTRAFVAACPLGAGLYVGRDLRASSPDLAAWVMDAARGQGVAVTDCGALPTPALALAAMGAGAAAVMVTGSHIPDDRNGLKFYTPTGEITKADESAIAAHLGQAPRGLQGALSLMPQAGAAWVARIVAGFGTGALSGLHIGVWDQSSVARDLLADALVTLGARVTRLDRRSRFLAVDTEAIPEDVQTLLAGFIQSHGLDGIVSTDGDGDRPLMIDATGAQVAGDVLGQITAAHLGAETVVTTISANSGVVTGGRFARVIRTRIGSPFVIAAMEQATGRVAGYEPNGGFLLGFDALSNRLPALITRDSLLPIVATLAQARAAGGIAARVAQEPAVFTAADRMEGVGTDRTLPLIARLTDDPAALLAELGEAQATCDLTDGLRIALQSGATIHLRPSGNAPELRLYTEAGSPAAARILLAKLHLAVTARL